LFFAADIASLFQLRPADIATLFQLRPADIATLFRPTKFLCFKVGRKSVAMSAKYINMDTKKFNIFLYLN
jgi:hypothetical protein